MVVTLLGETTLDYPVLLTQRELAETAEQTIWMLRQELLWSMRSVRPFRMRGLTQVCMQAAIGI